MTAVATHDLPAHPPLADGPPPLAIRSRIRGRLASPLIYLALLTIPLLFFTWGYVATGRSVAWTPAIFFGVVMLAPFFSLLWRILHPVRMLTLDERGFGIDSRVRSTRIPWTAVEDLGVVSWRQNHIGVRILDVEEVEVIEHLCGPFTRLFIALVNLRRVVFAILFLQPRLLNYLTAQSGQEEMRLNRRLLDYEIHLHKDALDRDPKAFTEICRRWIAQERVRAGFERMPTALTLTGSPLWRSAASSLYGALALGALAYLVVEVHTVDRLYNAIVVIVVTMTLLIGFLARRTSEYWSTVAILALISGALFAGYFWAAGVWVAAALLSLFAIASLLGAAYWSLFPLRGVRIDATGFLYDATETLVRSGWEQVESVVERRAGRSVGLNFRDLDQIETIDITPAFCSRGFWFNVTFKAQLILGVIFLRWRPLVYLRCSKARESMRLNRRLFGVHLELGSTLLDRPAADVIAVCQAHLKRHATATDETESSGTAP